MLGSKIDLIGNEWLDVVFDKKNKSYGAYALRKQSNSNTTKALFISGALFILLFLSPKIITLLKGGEKIDDPYTTNRVVDVQPPPAIDKKPLPEPTPVEPPKAKQTTKQFLPPIVVEKAVDADPVMIKDLEKANPGQKSIEGAPDGELVMISTPGEGIKQAAILEDTKVYDQFVSLEVQPTFPGGMDKFYAYLSKAIRYPASAQELNIQGKVFLSFIIEKSGALTDIKIERKLGYGTDEEALRVLKASPRWIPGIQNGKPVRVKYNIPISFALAQ